MSVPRFTILLPVHRPPDLLRFAIPSVLAQERQDFELFIICDGTPPETVALAESFAAGDARLRVFAHPKGERNGERYRHQALAEARGDYVCQLGDDDLWLPNHLDEMAKLLAEVDFGNLSHVEIFPDGSVLRPRSDLADPKTRRRMLDGAFNFFGPTVAGYRLSAYRALPVGWSPAPTDMASDLFMWRKFLAQDGLRFGTRQAISTLKFAAGSRVDWTIEQRATEIAAWAEKLSAPGGHAAVTQLVLKMPRKTLPGPVPGATARDAQRPHAKIRKRRLPRLLRRLGRLLRLKAMV